MYSTVQYMKACGGRGIGTPLGSLQRPPESTPPVKHTSLHYRLGVLKCSKLTYSKLEFQIFSPLLDPPLNTMNRAGNCLTPALCRVVSETLLLLMCCLWRHLVVVRYTTVGVVDSRCQAVRRCRTNAHEALSQGRQSTSETVAYDSGFHVGLLSVFSTLKTRSKIILEK